MSVALQLLSTARTSVGVLTWASPGATYRAFGLGDAADAAGSAGVVARLFAARDLAMGLALRHPDPSVRRAVLQAGLAIDAVDTVASVVGWRRGAPAASLLGVAAGAAAFVALGAVALRDAEGQRYSDARRSGLASAAAA